MHTYVFEQFIATVLHTYITCETFGKIHSLTI